MTRRLDKATCRFRRFAASGNDSGLEPRRPDRHCLTRQFAADRRFPKMTQTSNRFFDEIGA